MNSPDRTPRPPNPPRRRWPWETRAPDGAPDARPLWLRFVTSDPRITWAVVSLGVWLVFNAALVVANNLAWPSYLLLRALDTATGAAALPAAPFVVWTIWGAIFGGLLGHWLVAPLYGGRENRSWPLYLALLGMLLMAALLWAFVR